MAYDQLPKEAQIIVDKMSKIHVERCKEFEQKTAITSFNAAIPSKVIKFSSKMLPSIGVSDTEHCGNSFVKTAKNVNRKCVIE